MADPRFFTRAGPFTLGRLAELTGAQLSDPAAASKEISDVAPLQDADGAKLSFLDNRKYLESFRATKAGACIVRPDFAAQAPQGVVCLLSKNPYKAYALAAQAFYPEPAPQEFRAPTAFVDSTAAIGKGCSVEHGAFIGKNVKIGNGCRIQPNVVICDGVEIGDGCDIGANSYLTHCTLGPKVRLYPGVVIGRPGFGFAIDPAGFVSVPQLGRVIIEAGVEIGANSTIDRGAGPDTVIGAGTRIDNLVQIGHNVKIGRMCVLVAQTGISGSTQFGDGVITGGQSGFAGHLNIGSGSKIAAQSGIMRDLEPKSEVMGTPAVPLRQFMRQVALLAKKARKEGGANDDND
jgi:UDP-3-O-[3-hydroxymyristoyl] glucosamine N-acyltransferase